MNQEYIIKSAINLGIYEQYIETIKVLQKLPYSIAKSLLAFYKLSIVTQSAWLDYTEDLNLACDTQPKFFPRFFISDFGQMSFGYIDEYQDTSMIAIPSCLLFPTKESAHEAVQKLTELYFDLLIPNPEQFI